MKALDMPANETICIVDKPEPSPREDCAIISVAYTGICGSDMHVYLGHGPRVKPPTQFTLGHESSGIVDWAPEGSGLKKGDRIAVNPLVGCGSCPHCKSGKPNLCVDRTVLGFQRDGTFAEKVSVPLANIIPIGNLDLKLGAFIEPVTVAVHAVRQGAGIFSSSDRIIVVGGGTIGILCALVCREHYPDKKITVVEIADERRAMISSLGFEVSASIDAVKNSEPYAFLECTGNAKLFASLFELVPAPMGIQIVSVFPRTAAMELFWFIKHEILVNSSQMYIPADFASALALMQKQDFARQVASVIDPKLFTLDMAASAFKYMLSMKKYAKVLVSVTEA